MTEEQLVKAIKELEELLENGKASVHDVRNLRRYRDELCEIRQAKRNSRWF